MASLPQGTLAVARRSAHRVPEDNHTQDTELHDTEDGTLYYTGASYAENFGGLQHFRWDSVNPPSPSPPPLRYVQEQVSLDLEDFLGASLTCSD